VDAEEAYAECERITWSEARNFAYGIRLLPPPKRRALAAVYAFARRIDDIGDGNLPKDEKAGQLEEARAQLHGLITATGRTLPAGGGSTATLDDSDPVLVALVDTGKNFDIPLEAFGELIDGCLADVNETVYETFDDLLYYCRCVAGSIGRLSLGIYGKTQPERQEKMADDLGVALQLTNILRDVREDYLNGRVYLPREDLEKFGCEITTGGAEPFPTDAQKARFAGLVDFEAARAREWYASGLRLLATIDRRSAACTGAMAGIYHRLLEKIASNPAAVLQTRMSLPAGEKVLVAAQSLSGIDRWRYRPRGDNSLSTPRNEASSAGGRRGTAA
jgi:phytoene synthase